MINGGLTDFSVSAVLCGVSYFFLHSGERVLSTHTHYCISAVGNMSEGESATIVALLALLSGKSHLYKI